ncbi:uncharacterized protein PgNI_03179 [Pyricularia grisea]|uniref:Uncharacterized protein n=1 Tax=Pyricularia grisea TaxID=148305 RepID=A0A6P8B9N2_PYRGI|nr:uncharacterized protein PgNI_03179 [Pyricularia grisea]TLD12511.1 hypothetical protein PgNI_03179 [Pyricularia grisea]
MIYKAVQVHVSVMAYTRTNEMGVPLLRRFCIVQAAHLRPRVRRWINLQQRQCHHSAAPTCQIRTCYQTYSLTPEKTKPGTQHEQSSMADLPYNTAGVTIPLHVLLYVGITSSKLLMLVVRSICFKERSGKKGDWHVFGSVLSSFPTRAQMAGFVSGDVFARKICHIT